MIACALESPQNVKEISIAMGAGIIISVTGTMSEAQSPAMTWAYMILSPLIKLEGLVIGIVPIESKYQLTCPLPPLTESATEGKLNRPFPVPSSQA